MCGILVTGGINRPFTHGILRSLRKRGPDAIGFWTDSKLNLAQTRLAILGLDENGDQPLENERHVLSFNGEIYNFLDLKQELASRGVRFQGSSDSEVLLHAWTQWGPAALGRLYGFWAFAVYDKQTGVLTLVRDQLGIKPLYYWHESGTTIASSLIRTILEVSEQSPELDYGALSEYVRYQFTFGDKTFVRQIRKVLPGHLIEIDVRTGRLEDRCYEDILRPAQHSSVSFTPELISETRAILEECVQSSTISDTSFTTFCSGGMDSSLITAIASPEVAYHCNYSDSECNETFFAREVVEPLSTRLMVVNAQEDLNLVDKLTNLLEDFDELTIGSVILPLDDLLAQVKRRYKVILTGTGGDELFAGYVRYQLAMGECYQDSYRALFDKMRRVESVADRFEMTHRKGNVSVYKFYQDSAEITFREHFDACRNGGNDLYNMLTFDRRYFLSGLLNIDDKMCGRHSLESRPSFLHQKLVRHVLTLEPGAFLRESTLKYLLREIAEPRLPKSIVRRTDKMGFTTPIGTFVNENTHLIREHIYSSPFRDLYNLPAMHLNAETKFSRETFGLLMLDLWLNRYARSNAHKCDSSLAVGAPVSFTGVSG